MWVSKKVIKRDCPLWSVILHANATTFISTAQLFQGTVNIWWRLSDMIWHNQGGSPFLICPPFNSSTCLIPLGPLFLTYSFTLLGISVRQSGISPDLRCSLPVLLPLLVSCHISPVSILSMTSPKILCPWTVCFQTEWSFICIAKFFLSFTGFLFYF